MTTIAEIFGHTSLESTRIYGKADLACISHEFKVFAARAADCADYADGTNTDCAIDSVHDIRVIRAIRGQIRFQMGIHEKYGLETLWSVALDPEEVNHGE